MTVGYTRQSAGSIVTGATIQASHFNAEYNKLEDVFNASTGHNHDGTAGAGAKIPISGLFNLTDTTEGILCADGVNGVVARTLTAPAAGITITNGPGSAGNPTLVLANDLAALENISSTGMAVRTATDNWTVRTITGTSAEITVTNGSGVSGAPTISLPTSLTFTGKTVTGGTFVTPIINSPTITTLSGSTASFSGVVSFTGGDATTPGITFSTDNNTGLYSAGADQLGITTGGVNRATFTTTGLQLANALAVLYGGTGQTSYTNGQLLIGNTTGNTLTKATLTAPAAGISITNGTGSITFALTNDLSALEGLSSTGLAVRTASDTWTVRTITGTSNKIDVTNGDGVSGAPTITISATYIGQTSITTLGTITTGTWNGTDIAVADGGTGASTASAAFDNLKQAATTSATGVVELATAAEMNTGTDTGRVPSVSVVKNHPGVAKAWISFEGDGTTNNSYNCSVAKNATGDYTFTFATAFSGTNYAGVSSTQSNGLFGPKAGGTKTTSTWQWQNVVSNTGVATDVAQASVVFYGEQ